MSIESVSRALNVDDARLTTTERFVLVGMANHDGDGGCWPAIATLARYTGITERSVQRAIGRLETLGYVTRQIGEGGTHQTRNDRRPNRYTLHLRGDASVTPSTVHGVTSTTPRGDMETLPRGDTHVTRTVLKNRPRTVLASRVSKADAAAARALSPAAAEAVDIYVQHRILTKRPNNPSRYGATIRKAAETDPALADYGDAYADGDPVGIAVEVFELTLSDALIAQSALTGERTRPA